MTDKRFIFVIGFNRCGTTSIHMMLKKSGIRCLQYRADDSDTVLGAALAANLSAGRPLLAGLQRFTAFMDMGMATPQIVFEGCRLFWQLHAEHPDSYFILNTRPLEHWVDSRQFHLDGRFVANYAKVYGYDEIKIQQIWRKQYATHLADVREHFTENDGKFLEFDVENDDPEKIAAFLYADYQVDHRNWGHWNATDYDALADDAPGAEHG